MADVTVKQLADTVGAPVDRLLKQMQEAGLGHKSEGDAVTEEQKQVLLGFLKRSHGDAAKPAEKINRAQTHVFVTASVARSAIGIVFPCCARFAKR